MRHTVVFLLVQLFSIAGITQTLHAQAKTAAVVTKTAKKPGSVDEYSRVVESAVEAYNHDDFGNARKYFARAHELRPSARTWRGLGTTAFELKYFEDAVRELTFALEDKRSALPEDLRAETELTLRVARRRSVDRNWQSAHAVDARRSHVAVAKLPPPEADATPQQHGPGLFSSQRIAALTLAGAGLVSIAVGIGFGVHSLNQAHERDRLCPMPTQGDGCPAGPAVRAADAALLAGNISTAAWVVGGLAVAGGVVLWVTGAPTEHPQAPAASLSLGPGSLRLNGVF